MIGASVGFTLESGTIYSVDLNTSKCFSDADGNPTYEGLTGSDTLKFGDIEGGHITLVKPSR